MKGLNNPSYMRPLKSLLFLLVPLIFIFYLFPNPRHFFEVVPGDSDADNLEHLWGYWWVVHELHLHGKLPLFTEITHYPHGRPLFFIDTFGALISYPFHLLRFPAPYNAVLLLNLVFAFFSQYLLTIKLVRDKFFSFISGLIFSLSPILLSHIHNGLTELLHVGWLPLYLLTLYNLSEGKGGRFGFVYPSLVLTIVALTGWYNWTCAMISMLLFVIFHLKRKGEYSRVSRWRVYLYHIITSFVMILPYAAFFYTTLAKKGGVLEAGSRFLKGATEEMNMVDIYSFVNPWHRCLYSDTGTVSDVFIHSPYIGLLPLLLSIIYLLMKRGDRFIKVLFISSLLFSMGPYLYIDCNFPRIGGYRLPLPFIVFKYLPFLSSLNFPYRFIISSSMCAGIMIGDMLRIMDITKWKGYLIGSIILSIILLDYLFLSPIGYPIKNTKFYIPEFYHFIGKDIQDYAILDFPPDKRDESGEYLMYQVVHKKRIPYGVNVWIADKINENNFFKKLFSFISGDETYISDDEIRSGIHRLKTYGYRYILIHKKRLQRDKLLEIQQYLGKYMNIEFEDKELLVYIMNGSPKN